MLYSFALEEMMAGAKVALPFLFSDLCSLRTQTQQKRKIF